jgi:two-component system sensor histidine kinase DesK
MRQWLAKWFRIAPDSLAAQAMRRGKSPWVDAVHLLWSLWVFVVPALTSEGWSLRWAWLTICSYPLFLLLFALCCVAPWRHARFYALGLAVLSLGILPWYPSGLTYFIYGCVFLRGVRRSLRRYLAELVALNAALLAEALSLGYSWQSLVSIPLTTIIVGVTVQAEYSNAEKEAQLRLSHEEIRRLAATAERERIGRDLHDLLGHTLSLITLKLELSRKLFERDAEAARREVAEAERVARHALAEVRAAVTGIRATDLAAELASARLLLESSGVRLDYGLPPDGLPPETERPLALVLREAVTNIHRHAGASKARIVLDVDEERLRMTVSDDGRGGLVAHGNGVSGMRERVRALGGAMEIGSPPGRGTVIAIEVPLERRRSAEPVAAAAIGSPA